MLSHVHFIVQHFPFHSLATLSSVLSSYLLRSDYLTPYPDAPSPSPISHVSLHLRLHLPSLASPLPSPLLPLSHRLSLSSSSLSPPSRDRNPWGYVDVLHEPPPPAPSAGLYLLHLEAGKAIPLHVHRVMSEAELVLSPGLLCQGEAVPVGVGHRWGGSVHGYRNEGQGVEGVLCIDSPAFIREDEIEVDGEPDRSVKAFRAGQDVWQAVARGTLGAGGGLQGPVFSFPGCYAEQECRLAFEAAQFVRADAVLVLMLGGVGEEEVLCVHHRVRGWELPGGKVEEGEEEVVAAVREMAEEAGVRVQPHQLIRIAQYQLTEDGDAGRGPHVKSVYMGEMDAELEGGGVQWKETDAAQMRRLPTLAELAAKTSEVSGWSALVHDNVVMLCLQLAREVRSLRVSTHSSAPQPANPSQG